MKPVAKLLDQPSATVMRQVTFIEDKIYFSSTFGHRKQNTPRGAFDSEAQNRISTAISQAISPNVIVVDAFLRINALAACAMGCLCEESPCWITNAVKCLICRRCAWR